MLASTNTNTIRQVQPTIKLPKTSGCDHPRLTDSMNPFTKPPNPRVTTRAPIQSTLSPSGVAAFGNAPQRNGDYRCRKREIDEKDPAPGSVLNEPAAQHRTKRGGDRRET